MRANYLERFEKFITYWTEKGSAVRDDILPILPPEAEIMEEFSKRGKKNKHLVRFASIPDTLPAKIESSKAAPTWRRMAICILKNDYICKGLSFTQTKNQAERMKQLIEKYRNI